MQRVRVGLTGLAFVFLLVMLATAFLRMAGGSENGSDAAPVAGNAATPSEPLAQLGVAPGNPQQTAPVATKPQSAAPRAPSP
jgi:hypothetical protein